MSTRANVAKVFVTRLRDTFFYLSRHAAVVTSTLTGVAWRFGFGASE